MAIVVLLPCLVVGYTAYKYFVTKGFQAEVKIYMSYLDVLEKAYFLEENKYIGFDAYGADRRGENLCERPEGAVKLGFRIRWCEGFSGSSPARYFYAVDVEAEKEFRIVAESGSDGNHNSFVCFGEDGSDIWQKVNESKEVNTKGCPFTLLW